jgi:putative endonuclease
VSRTGQRLGRAAEALVAERLESIGMRILARNERTSEVAGELDLVAMDGSALVFVEVKARSAGSIGGPERPVEAVGPRKQRKLRALALAWIRDHRGALPPHSLIRFDVVGVRLDPGGDPVEWEHLRGAF